MIWMRTPTPIPNSNSQKRQTRKQANPGMRSISGWKKSVPDVLTVTMFYSLLLLQMGLTTWCSTLKMTAVMMTAARVALGMKAV